MIRLRRRGRADLAGADRALLFAAGLALVVLPLVSPLDGVADRYLLSAHMLQHVLIADAGPALLVLAVRGPLGFFLVPAPLLRKLAALRPLLRVLVRPDVAFLVWVATILGWHFPSTYDYTLLHPWAHELEHATFVLAGTLAWIQVADPARRGHLTRGGRALVAFGMLAFGTAVVDGLLFSSAPAYAVYAAQPHRVFGLTALLDQRLGARDELRRLAVDLGGAEDEGVRAELLHDLDPRGEALGGELERLGPQPQHEATAAVRGAPRQRDVDAAEPDGPVRAQRHGAEVHRGRADEARDEGVHRPVVELPRRADLLEAPVAEDGDAMPERHRLGLVVRDVDRRDREVRLERRDVGAHLHAQLRVEVRERLVHQEHLREADDGTPHRDPLPLAAGELSRLAVEVLLEPEHLRHLAHALEPHRFLDARHLEREGHVRLDG